jgi:DUF4097 and DUF4098 domain-containing protein YvlB
VDTGSGNVSVSDLNVSRLDLDVGSGNITATTARAPDMRFDSGSGDVDVALVGDVDRMVIDTGSGSVTLHVSDSLGASIVVDTGSGGVQTDIPIRVSSVSRDYLRGVIGDGKGTIKIDTGSGSVHLVK